MRRTPAEVREAVACVVDGGWGTERQFHSAFSFYASFPGSFPFVAVKDERIVGTATGNWYGRTGWVGHVFVPPEMRGFGLGRRLTETAIEQLRKLGCKTISLAATELGYPLYKAMGFKRQTEYHEMRGVSLPRTTGLHPLRPMLPSDRPRLGVLDRRVSGESRGYLLPHFSGYGWCLDRDEAMGAAVLPTPWGGAMASLLPGASEAEAMALLRGLRTLGGMGGEVIVYMPTENSSGLALLHAEGFEELRLVPRMVLGDPVKWTPSAVWNTFSMGLG